MVTLEPIDAGAPGVRRRDPSPATSPAEQAVIAQRIRSTIASHFWSMPLLPGPRRKAIQALYAFCRESAAFPSVRALGQ
jgi:hypothetical protein